MEELDRRCLPATFLVNNLTDAPIVGQTSLREAIALANADPGSTIAFDPAALGGSPRTIVLARGELEITAAVTIAGPGAGALAISGGNASRIFDIDDGTAATIAVSISGLTLADGNAAGGAGGAIRSAESLALADSTISNSLALDGGGIANIGGNLRLDRVALAGNVAKGGDGVDSPFPSNVQYTYTWLAGSYTDNGGAAGGARGGGIYSSGGAVMIADSTLTNNQAQGGEGGRGGWTLNGIRSGNGGNGGAGDGGGIYSGGGFLELIGSTLSGNSALGGAGGYGGRAGYPLNGAGGPTNVAGNAGAGGVGRGGGLFADAGSSVTLTNSTLSDNAARGGIGGDGLWGWNGYGGEASNDDPDHGGGGSGEGGGLFATRTGGVLISDSAFVRNLAVGGDSGDGGVGSDVGGSGAIGGEARGGGLFLSANGAVAVVRTTIALGAATGGKGGDGGTGVDYGGLGIIGGDARGGGIYLSLGGPAEIADSLLFGNTAAGGAGGDGGDSNGWAGPGGAGGTAAGGGAFVEGASARFSQTTFSGNSARGGNGGAGASSTFMFPWSSNGEGGVGGSGLGGGLFSRSAISLSNTTIVSGAATRGGSSSGAPPQYAGVGRGGNFYNEWSATLNNTLIAGSLAGGDVYTPGSFAGSSSLIQDPTNQPLIDGVDGNIIGHDPRLGVLSYYGGPTATVPLLGDSPAIDAGDSGLAVDAQGNPLANDQRGAPFVRMSGAGVDIGAFERQEIAARTFVVNTAADDGGGPGLLTLREALGLANAAPGSTIAFDTAAFSTPRTIALARGELPAITADVTINGPGARLLTISGGDRFRILTINDRSPDVIDVTISGLTLDRGNPNGGAGGAIFNTENLALIDSTVSGSTARVGGGIYNSGVLNLSGCTITGNATADQGDENLPPGGYAYGIRFGFGAGLYNIGSATLINSTITGNKAVHFGGVAAGIFNYYGPLTLTNCTVAGNDAASVGEIGSVAPITMNNTLVVGEPGVDFIVGGISGANNWIGADPGLDPAGLKDNGGPTDTIALLPGSAAIDAGSNALLPAGLDHDQRGRGFARAFNGTVDIGAFEYSTAPSVTAVTSTTLDGSYGVGSAIVIEVAFGGPVTVVGAPSLLLNSGGTAVYASGSGTDRLVFIYSVATGQGSSDLDYASAAALQLNGGSIRDAAGRDVDLALPAPGVAGSLGANKDIAIDTTAPTVLAFRLLFGGSSYDLIGSPGRILPWRITGIQVVFSKPIATGSAASLAGLTTTGLIGLGTTTLTWSIDPLTGGAFSPSLLAAGADALRDAAGNAVGGGAGFSAPFRVLYGDYNGDGAVSSADVTGILMAASLGYNMLADLDLNGVVDANDARIARSRIGSKL